MKFNSKKDVWKVASGEVQGTSHVKNGIPCQDKTFVFTDGNFTAISLADGAGSAIFSEKGAELVTRKATETLKIKFDEFYKLSASDIKTKLIHVLRTNLGKYASRTSVKIKDLDSTLVFVAIKENKFIAGHIGDGILGYMLDGELIILSPPRNGEFVNHTYFVTSNNYHNHFQLFKGKIGHIDGFVLMSDGTCEGLFDVKNFKIAPIVKNVIDWLGNHTQKEVTDALIRNLEDVIRSKTTDDCSMAIAKRIVY